MRKTIFILGLIVAGYFLYDGLITVEEKTVAIAEIGSYKETGTHKPVSLRKQKVKGFAKKDSPNKFVEWLHDIKTRETEVKPSYPFNYKVNELLKSKNATTVKEFTAKSLSKRIVGVGFEERGPGNVSGRTRDLVVDPDDSNHNTWYAGSVGGGVWKTTDAGASWSQLTPDIGNLATSTIVQAKTDPNVMYVGTGEGFYNLDGIVGSGIWKSNNRGTDWEHLSSTSTDQFRIITRMVIDPQNKDIVLAATAEFNGTTSAIMRTINGGITWSKVTSVTSGRIQDLVADPTNFNNIYATTNAGQVLKSTNAGVSWVNSNNGIGSIGRMEIAISQTNPSVLYITGPEGGGSALYVSRNKGGSWAKTTAGNGNNINWLGGQGWYDNTVEVHPYDENTVFVGGIDIFKIKVNSNNATTITNITDGYGQYGGSSKGVHVDQHNIVFVKTNVGQQQARMIVCNDGGVSYSDNYGASFSHTENGYNTSQFYGVDKKNGVDQYIGGMQDNSSVLSTVDPGVNATWTVKLGGDGFESVWNYTDPTKLMVSYQYNGFFKSLNSGASFSSSQSGLEDVGSGKAPFFSRLAASKQDGDLLFAHGASGIWRSSNFGNSWQLVANPPKFSGTRSFAQVKISLKNPQVVWAGSSLSTGGGLYVSKDGGSAFNEVAGLSTPMGSLTGIATDHKDANVAYVLFSYANAPKIFRTKDLGQSWEELSGFGSGSTSSNGFPDVAVFSLLVFPYNRDKIWVGTEIGIFESLNDGQTWQKAEYSLPNVAVYDMKIVNDEVVVATHGRGIWTLYDAELDGFEPDEVVLAPAISAVTYSSTALKISSNLRAAYDSTQVLVDENKVGKTGANQTGEQTISVPYSSSTTEEITVQLISYKDGSPLYSSSEKILYLSKENPLSSYQTTFEPDPSADFITKGFKVAQLDNDKGLHSDHPYLKSTEYSYTLKKGIVLSGQESKLTYRDIAIIEPGEAGTNYGDNQFWDYVVVEGTKDGSNWVALEDGYDARANSTWLNLYNNGGSINSSTWVKQSINLLDKFATGDTIFVRFRLYSDPEAVGWGWAVDDIAIQTEINSVGTKPNIVNGFKLEQNYPNPFNPTTQIRFSLEKNSPVTLKVFDNTGRLIKTILNGKNFTAGQTHSAQWDGTNSTGAHVASGTYYYQLNSVDKTAVKKMVLIR